MSSGMTVYHAKAAAGDQISMTAGLRCLTCGHIVKIVQRECIRAKNIIRFAPRETRLFSFLDTHDDMERLASHFGIQTPDSFDIHQTGPGAARILDEALKVMSRNTVQFARLSNRQRADLLGAFCATIDAHQRAYQAMAANPSRFDPEMQQYLKNIKVIVSYEDEDKEITWVAENTATHTTRRLEFLVERVATALIPTMSVWMDHSEAQIGTADTCLVCGRDDQ
ncbi:hypothetical protein GGR55DRAFT_674244 [Xylaria sp. FL0064]|nr:hypothetical protein GGR55DRAFT_684477 [Xylaria sp. FL0064]KAI0818411.1 hypothetical protein GGR55DRAFT_674244 [Xylaria sp. FL0064]